MRQRTLVFLLMLGVAVVALACGDDKKPATTGDPFDAYFAQLADIGNSFLDAIAAQPQGLDPSAPIAQQVDVYETYARGLSDNIRSARDGLNGLEPPPEVADAHAALLASVENALTVAQSLEDQLGSINSSDEMQQLTNNSDVTNALQQFQTACSALRDIATQHNVQREVRCE